MSPEDNEKKSDALESLIAKFLDLENSGITVDRYKFLADHAEHAEGLLAFFTEFDEEQTNTARKAASPPTRNAIVSNRSPQATKEVGDITYEAHGVSRPRSRAGGLASDGLSGIAVASMLACAGAFIGFTIADVDNREMSEYFLHIPLLITKLIGAMIGAVVGGIAGFPVGVFVGHRLRKNS